MNQTKLLADYMFSLDTDGNNTICISEMEKASGLFSWPCILLQQPRTQKHKYLAPSGLPSAHWVACPPWICKHLGDPAPSVASYPRFRGWNQPWTRFGIFPMAGEFPPTFCSRWVQGAPVGWVSHMSWLALRYNPGHLLPPNIFRHIWTPPCILSEVRVNRLA